jgi:hypothetical protein
MMARVAGCATQLTRLSRTELRFHCPILTWRRSAWSSTQSCGDILGVVVENHSAYLVGAIDCLALARLHTVKALPQPGLYRFGIHLCLL